MLALALAPWLVIATACPSPQAVIERMERLGDVGSAWDISFTTRGDVVVLDASSGGVAVTRELPAGASCEALEEAAAVILVSHASSAEERAVPTRRVVTPALPGSEPSAPTTSAVRLTVGVGPSLVVSESSPALGGLVFLQLRPASFPLALGVAVTGAAPRSLGFGGGELLWGRLSVGLGPELPVERGPASLNLWTHVVMGALWLSARDYAQDWDLTSWDLGVRAGVRLEMLASGPLRAFVGLSGTGWIRWHRARLSDSADLARLPWLELEAAAGLVWRG